jgi:hypothetical protein
MMGDYSGEARYHPTPEILARLACIDRTNFNKILHGHRTPSAEQAARIYKATGYKFGVLMHLSDTDANRLCMLLERSARNKERGIFL